MPKPDDTPWTVDWNVWRTEWALWQADHAELLATHCDHRWPRPSIAADAVLDRVHLGGRCVELSELTMMVSNRTRHVGIAYLVDGGPNTEPGPLCSTPAELSEALGLG